MTNVLIAADEMAWINVKDSNFAKEGLSVHFSNNHIICSRGPEAGLKIDAADIIFLNDPPRSQRISGGVNTNLFRNIFKGGPVIAMILAFFGFAKKRKQRTQKIIVKFKGDRFIIGHTDFDTFFEIQNAWLDRK